MASQRPIYCRHCGTPNTFERYEAKDVKGVDSGKVYWEGWKCKKCDQTTIRQSLDK